MGNINEQIDKSGQETGEIRHPLTDKDGEAVAAMRKQVAPFKGKMNGPEARPSFDETMEQTPDASGVSYDEGTCGGVPGVWCRPKDELSGAAILYLHGGAYVLGSAHAYRHFAGQIAARTNVTAFVADYRLAPEHSFPAAVDDAKAVYRGLVEQDIKKIAIVGDSAGGGLVLVMLAVAQSDTSVSGGVAPVAAAVMSPWTDLALTGKSMETRADDDPLVTKDMLTATAAHYLKGHDSHDPLVSPLYGNLAGLPPIQLHAGTSEVLLDDTRRYAERARAAGVEATVHVWDGMTHVFPASVGTLEAAEAALEIITDFLTEKLG